MITIGCKQPPPLRMMDHQPGPTDEIFQTDSLEGCQQEIVQFLLANPQSKEPIPKSDDPTQTIQFFDLGQHRLDTAIPYIMTSLTRCLRPDNLPLNLLGEPRGRRILVTHSENLTGSFARKVTRLWVAWLLGL